MPTINMRSSSSIIKGQGVNSCFDEQVKLVSDGLNENFKIYVNKLRDSDIVHYHTVNLNYYFERQLKKGKSSCISYVHFLPDTLEDSLNLPPVFKKIFYKYLLHFYNSMDYLVTVNPCIVQKLLTYDVKNPKIIYIPNFVSEKSFYAQTEEVIRSTKIKLGLNLDRFTVLGAGQLQTRKGIIDFVETAKRLPNIQFLWAGGFSFGRISDGYAEIKIIRDNPPDNIKFLGIIDREEMVSLYNAADLFFLPSFDELFPMTILEALSCKKPLLLRDIPIYPDILFEYYAKGSSVEEFTETIAMLSKNPNELKLWKEKAWECHKFYSEDRILKMWEELYREAYSSIQPKDKSR